MVKVCIFKFDHKILNPLFETVLSHVHIVCYLRNMLLFSKFTMKTNTNVHVTFTISFSSLYLSLHCREITVTYRLYM